MQNDADYTREAQKIWAALRPMVQEEIKTQSDSCVRAKKMIVVTPPNGRTVGVSEPFGPVIDLPYSTAISNIKIGDSVWVHWFFNNASTMFVAYRGNGQLFDPISMELPSNSLLTNLESSFPADSFAQEPRPGVTGVLPIFNGGTGESTLQNAQQAMGAAFHPGETIVFSGTTFCGSFQCTSQSTLLNVTVPLHKSIRYVSSVTFDSIYHQTTGRPLPWSFWFPDPVNGASYTRRMYESKGDTISATISESSDGYMRITVVGAGDIAEMYGVPVIVNGQFTATFQ